MRLWFVTIRRASTWPRDDEPPRLLVASTKANLPVRRLHGLGRLEQLGVALALAWSHVLMAWARFVLPLVVTETSGLAIADAVDRLDDVGVVAEGGTRLAVCCG